MDRRYRTLVQIRRAGVPRVDNEERVQCNVTACDETDARRKVVARAMAQGYAVSRFLAVEKGSEV